MRIGSVPWNSGKIKTDQTGVKDGYKRCSQQKDPRCKKSDGVHPLDNFRFTVRHRPTSRRADCKYCESYSRYKYTRLPSNIEGHRQYQRDYKKQVYQMAINHKPYRVEYDPERMYRRGAEFSKADFENSLAGGVWPWGMYVRYIDSGECFRVFGTSLYPTTDRDWKQYARTQFRHTDCG